MTQSNVTVAVEDEVQSPESIREWLGGVLGSDVRSAARHFSVWWCHRVPPGDRLTLFINILRVILATIW